MLLWEKTVHKNSLAFGESGCLNLKGQQIALIHLEDDSWHAVQNECPQCNQMVIARGITGDKQGEPKVVCPVNKQSFSLRTGVNFESTHLALTIYPVIIKNDYVYVELEN